MQWQRWNLTNAARTLEVEVGMEKEVAEVMEAEGWGEVEVVRGVEAMVVMEGVVVMVAVARAEGAERGEEVGED